MPTEAEVRERLEHVLVPGTKRSLAALNLVRNIAVADSKIDIALASTALSPTVQTWLGGQVRGATMELPGVEQTVVDFVPASPSELNDVRQMVAVMSGKGGVGKSLIASLLGVALARQGQEVGILDADITGPSIPKIFGVSSPPVGSDTGILPVISRSGISIMSINLLLPNESDAVIWRGPLIAKTIQQFWTEVLWGRLHCLILDLPPGTADAALTVMQSLPLSGVVIVFSPQALTAMVVKKAIQMANTMDVPILGVVENMSYVLLPDTGKRLEVFGKSRAQEMAEAAGAPLLGQFPIDPRLAELCDQGNIELYDSDILGSFAQAFAEALATRAKRA